MTQYSVYLPTRAFHILVNTVTPA